MRRLLLVAAAAAALAGCGGTNSDEETVHVDRPPWMRGCDHIYYERYGLPQLLILSDLPLRGDLRSIAMQMTQGVKLVVKEHGFRTGRFSIAYVSCDTTGSNGTWSRSRCVAPMREAARRKKVIGVLLPIDLGCADAAVRELASAKPGPLASVAVINAALRLPERGAVRVVAPLAAQAAADAILVRDLGAGSVAVVEDGTAYGRRFARAFREAAAALDLEVVAEPEQAEAALVAGTLAPAGTRALRAARSALPAKAPLVLAPAFTPPAQVAEEVGAAAEGAYIGVSGVAGQRLPASGRDFAVRFEQAIHLPPHPLVLYAAQAAQLLLDAIAASDGTRPSVAFALRRSSGPGLVGWMGFDARGEPRVAPVSVLRIQGGMERLSRVIVPPRALWQRADSAVP